MADDKLDDILTRLRIIEAKLDSVHTMTQRQQTQAPQMLGGSEEPRPQQRVRTLFQQPGRQTGRRIYPYGFPRG